ncbi:MAG: hypothetical protein ACP5NY_04310 [Thermocladium sp.]
MSPSYFRPGLDQWGIAVVRASAYVVYIASIFFTASFTMYEYLSYNVGLWGLGFTAALIWYIVGVETKFKTLEQVNEQNISGAKH